MTTSTPEEARNTIRAAYQTEIDHIDRYEQEIELAEQAIDHAKQVIGEAKPALAEARRTAKAWLAMLPKDDPARTNGTIPTATVTSNFAAARFAED